MSEWVLSFVQEGTDAYARINPVYVRFAEYEYNQRGGKFPLRLLELIPLFLSIQLPQVPTTATTYWNSVSRTIYRFTNYFRFAIWVIVLQWQQNIPLLARSIFSQYLLQRLWILIQDLNLICCLRHTEVTAIFVQRLFNTQRYGLAI
jgi:hypothetical protein